MHLIRPKTEKSAERERYTEAQKDSETGRSVYVASALHAAQVSVLLFGFGYIIQTLQWFILQACSYQSMLFMEVIRVDDCRHQVVCALFKPSHNSQVAVATFSKQRDRMRSPGSAC